MRRPETSGPRHASSNPRRRERREPLLQLIGSVPRTGQETYGSHRRLDVCKRWGDVHRITEKVSVTRL